MSEYELHVDVVDRSGAAASFGPVMLNISAGPQTIERSREAHRLTQNLAERFGKIGSFSIVEPGAMTAQPAHQRSEISALLLSSPLVALALVLEGGGVRPAAARAMVAGYFALKRPYAVKVVSEVSPGLAWLVDELRRHGVKDLDAISLQRAIGLLRARVREGH